MFCYLQAFWNWVENYPDEFTKLYQIPQTDMAGKDKIGFVCLFVCFCLLNSYEVKTYHFPSYFCYYGTSNLFNLCQIGNITFFLYF